MPDLRGITMKAQSQLWKVLDLATLKRNARLHLPDLQRGFIWTPDRVRALHDSLCRCYPIGALLLWKPTWEGAEAPVVVREWDIWPPDPTTGRGTREPVGRIQPGSFFVLDGQQRLTSLFRVIFQSRLRNRTTRDPALFVALSPEPEWVENPFWLQAGELRRRMRDGLLIPAEVLFEGVRGGDESLAVQRAIGEWVTVGDPLFYKALDRANAIRTAILHAEIVTYEIDADADDENVIEIFIRLNQQGVRLRPGDLAAARLTGHMANFRHRAREVLQSSDFGGFAAIEGSEEHPRTGAFVDTDILVRTALYLAAGMIRYRDAERRKGDAERRQPYEKVEGQWDLAVTGLREAVALYRDAGIPDASWMPYRHLLLPPAVAYAKSSNLDKETWLGWAITASLWRHYSGEVETKLQKDCGLAEKGNVHGLIENVKAYAKRTESVIPEEEDFLGNIVNEAGLFLALLVHFVRGNVRSFPSGKLLKGAEEPLEVHHIFPRRVLDSYNDRDGRFMPGRFGNLTLLTRGDNEHLGGDEPAHYLADLSEEDQRGHLIPENGELQRVERYPEFCEEREKLIAAAVRGLLKSLGLK